MQRMKVEYKAGAGGAHSEQGTYRINPVTGHSQFHPWLGLGRAPQSFTTTEYVCEVCGACCEEYGHPVKCQECESARMARAFAEQ